MVFHWSLSDCKSPQISRSFLSILANLNNAVVWMVSTHPLISKSSSPYTNPFVTVPSATITIGVTVTFTFHRFFSSQARLKYLSVFSLSFNFTLWSAGTEYQRILCVTFSRTGSGFCIYHYTIQHVHLFLFFLIDSHLVWQSG